MLFSLYYKNSSNQEVIATVSGSNMSSAILYCDANDLIPTEILQQNYDLLLVNASLQQCFLVSMRDTNTQQVSSTLIYDTFSGVISWVNSQSNKVVRNLSLLDRAFIQA